MVFLLAACQVCHLQNTPVYCDGSDVCGSGTPAQLERLPEDLSMYGLGEGRVGPRKMTPADQSMRRSIQDLVSSIDPNVKVEPEVEDVSLLWNPLSDLTACLTLLSSFY